MAKQSLIEMRKAKALEDINMRLARIEEKLGIVDVPAPVPSEEPPTEEQAAEDGSESEAAPAEKPSRRKSKSS